MGTLTIRAETVDTVGPGVGRVERVHRQRRELDLFFPASSTAHIQIQFDGNWQTFSFVSGGVSPAAVGIRSARLVTLLRRELTLLLHPLFLFAGDALRKRPSGRVVASDAGIEKLLQGTPDKFDDFNTISHKMKRDLWRRFSGVSASTELTILEVGGHHGHTTRLLSWLFGRVIVMEVNADNIVVSQRNNADRDNIFWIQMDAYSEPWTKLGPNEIHAVFVDALHDYGSVISDIHNSFLFPHCSMLIFDDYGLPHFKWCACRCE